MIRSAQIRHEGFLQAAVCGCVPVIMHFNARSAPGKYARKNTFARKNTLGICFVQVIM
jgi:hypothetical protein